MFSGYRQSDFTDPAGAALSMCAVFEDYPDDIIKYATDPKTGVQRKCKWPPTISEVVEFCKERVDDAAFWERHRQHQLARPVMPQIEGPQEPKPTREEMIAKHGKDWGLANLGNARIASDDKPAPSWDRIVEQMQSDPSTIARLTGALMTRTKK